MRNSAEQPTRKRIQNAAVPKLLRALSSKTQTAEIEIGSTKLEFESLNRVLWPETGQTPPITKRDFLAAIALLSPLLLPHMTGRPLSVRRAPNGIGRKNFCQRHWTEKLPQYVTEIDLPSMRSGSQTEGATEYIICNNLPTLLFLAEHESLEFRGFTAKLAKNVAPEDVDWSDFTRPNLLLFVLGTRYGEVDNQRELDDYYRISEAAFWLKEAIQSRGGTAFVKTFRVNALHVVVPIKPMLDYADIRQLAASIRDDVVQRHPRQLTKERSVDKRAGKVFLDVSANSRARTVTCPYSPRPIKDALVSTPLAWFEVGNIIPSAFSLHTAESIAEREDPWAQIGKAAVAPASLF